MGPLSDEMVEVEYGDLRLERRLKSVVDVVCERPGASFPAMFRDDSAGLEALYRLVNNRRVTPQATLEPHIAATARRAAALDTVLVAHDSSDFVYKREQPPPDMGYLKGGKGGARGFVGHASLALDPAREGLPLGLVAFESLNRTGPRKGRRSIERSLADPHRESLRWLRGVSVASRRLSDVKRVVHVMDREGDFFELFAHVLTEGDDFVIRAQHDRQVQREGEILPVQLFETLARFDARVEREVPLSRRGRLKSPLQNKRHRPRRARVAKLEIAAGPVTIKRPVRAPKSWLKELRLHAVHVREPDPPAGEPAVEWKLLTTLEVTTPEQAAFVVDCYRRRWLIEELYKSLKTGCAFKQRQFDSVPALLNVLAILLPVAWRLLVLRNFGRQHPDLPATVVLTELEIEVLRCFARRKLSSQPTLGEVMWAVAGLGGHLKRNGLPGWITLARGHEQLQTLTEGWSAALKLMK